MSEETQRRLRVLICGTGFGRIHLRAVVDDDSFELAGILSRGSDSSRSLAEEHGVACYTDVDDVPDTIDVACVVVPSTTGAGEGSEIALRLLARGIHVLQEAPLLPDEIARALRCARDHQACFRVNTLYSEVDSMQSFLAAADAIRARQQPLFIDAACGVQVLYSLLDLSARCVGALRPWRFADPSTPPDDVRALAVTPAPYSTVHGVIGGIPLTLRVQNEIDPSDPDNHALLLHRISIGFEAGVLALADTHGPVLWSPRLHSERDDAGKLVLEGTERLHQVSSVSVGNTPPPRFEELFDQVWPRAIGRTLHRLRDDITDPTAVAQHSQWALGVSTLWQDLSERLGAVTLINRPAPRMIPLEEVVTT